MTLKKNSTDKKKFVFHTQLEKGNFIIFEEYPLSEIMKTYRTQSYYTIDAILKYFSTLEDKKNGIDILKEKLTYLKDKGFRFCDEFDIQSNYMPIQGNYQLVETPVSAATRIFNHHETYKNIYKEIFEHISDELISSPVMKISFQTIVSSSVYRKHKSFVSDFMPKFMNDIENRQTEITGKAISAMLSVKKEEESPTIAHYLPRMIDIYLTNNPHDNEIWCSILSKEDKLYYFHDLIKKHLLTKQNSDDVISHILKNTSYYSNKNNVIPYILQNAGYSFKNKNLEDYYDMEDVNLKKKLLPALIETQIQITDSPETRKIMAELINNKVQDKAIVNNLLVLQRLNERQNDIYSLSTIIENEKSLFQIYIESITPAIIKDSRGNDIENYGSKYAIISNEIAEDTELLFKNFYKEGDFKLFNNSISPQINIYLLPIIISSLLKKDSKSAFEIDLFELIGNYEKAIKKENINSLKTRINYVMYEIFHEYRKFVEKNKSFEEQLIFKNKDFYNACIKDMESGKGNKIFEEKRLKVQMKLFILNINNTILSKEDKKDFAQIIIENAKELSGSQLFNNEKFTSSLSFIERYFLNMEFNDTEKTVIKNIKTRI